jgi:acetylserotonin N-methyltransferase
MSQDTYPSHLDPSALLRARDGIYAADLLIAAIVELDFFNRTSHRSWTFEEIVSEFQIAARPADVLLTLLCAMKLVDKDRESYRIRQEAEVFLSQNSRWDLGPYFASLKLRPQVQQILHVLRTDEPAAWENTNANPDWATAMTDEAFARRFTAAMNGRGEWFGPGLARALRLDHAASLLDVGAGSGVYARILREHYPHVKMAVLEKSPVDRVARCYLESTDVGRNITVLRGDMFEDIPKGYGVHLFSNVLHDWSSSRVRELLARSRQSLGKGGQIAVHDAFIDRNKCGPLDVAEYSVLLMMLSQGQCYSIGDMEGYLLDAGFHSVDYRPTLCGRGVMIAQAG